MIDFRYHLVSIVAVFLALAVGIVVGSQALTPSVTNQLNKASAAEAKRNKMLYAHNTQLKNEIAADESFAQAAEASLLRGLLTRQSVVLVLAPGTDSRTVVGVTKALQLAGATVTGEVQLSAQFFDTGAVTEQQLKTMATSPASTGLALPSSASDPQISGQQEAARVIAAAIAYKDGVPTLPPAQTQRILTGFGQAGFLQINGPNGNAALAGQATMAVVIVPGTVPPAKTRGPVNMALISLTQDLQETSKGAVLAGPLLGSGPHSAIDAVSSGAAGLTLTTVDNAETIVGQTIVAQALSELLNGVRPAAYGVRPGAVPSPAPTATASPSPSPSRASKTRRSAR